VALRFRTVIFDCDSTLSAVEGIDLLAREHREEIARLTEQAMNGLVPLEEVYGRRLERIRPTREEIETVGREYIRAAVPGVYETTRRLREAGAVVQVLSGGLAPAVRVLTRELGLGDGQVAAVEIRFTPEGEYAGFDAASPLVRTGGKRVWIETSGAALPRPILLVGDGATDLEARPAVSAFAAFTGVVARPEVVRQADAVIAGPSLTAILPYCGLADGP
jgi:phosphoserine phosphatase